VKVNELRKFLIMIFGYLILLGMGVAINVYGWGLSPKSWGWILGGGTFGIFFGQLILTLSKD
jgi:hypothetical protein